MRVLWLSGLVVILDQATKYVVLQTMYLGQQIALVGDWLKFTYTENPGMAFGITFGPKAMVTVFSIIATILITMYLVKVRKGYFPYRASLGLILGGAIGNIIDRVFYGVLYGDDAFFFGKVVDFIHVNVWSGFIPVSVPFIGGTYLSLFPIWNVADMAIVCGVVGILAFQKEFHLHEHGLDGADHGVDAPDHGHDDMPDHGRDDMPDHGRDDMPDHGRGDLQSDHEKPDEESRPRSGEHEPMFGTTAESDREDTDLSRASKEQHPDEALLTKPRKETRENTSPVSTSDKPHKIESVIDRSRGKHDPDPDGDKVD